ncbi:hypothetical protein BGW36DRAFT_423788 [Talaromyces proteolyticus]|uniref:SWIM-type domain-containing protein n=1 Tax=Talaromyces proteolyticus TaxID=1131652 RepID=A0AAD4Q326_9EURO|nr:uncharacterized protein BGW36DRAFT_423788 [Talaromyces proteolyticus]KAH8704267.1 hypothetical protein BGW36DRAFT_423788 [Talaromyces proteolyticus]
MTSPNNITSSLDTAHLLSLLTTQLRSFTPPSNKNNNNDTTNLIHRPNATNLTTFPDPAHLQIKNLLLTLHCLFPNELLLALDILDRRLIRRYQQSRKDPETDEHNGIEGSNEVFFVQSKISSTSSNTTRMYEVRLDAWNCSCSAFALSWVQNLSFSDIDAAHDIEDGAGLEVDGSGRFDGKLVRRDAKGAPPVCKHLLACVLGTECPNLFGGGIDTSQVGDGNGLAGMCAGYAS